uniref:Translation initiation factor IF-2-like n=1 Tax=Camelus bactrianus TaxID=9837 RepID=A0A9W3F9R8_CAMBA
MCQLLETSEYYRLCAHPGAGGAGRQSVCPQVAGPASRAAPWPGRARRSTGGSRPGTALGRAAAAEQAGKRSSGRRAAAARRRDPCPLGCSPRLPHSPFPFRRPRPEPAFRPRNRSAGEEDLSLGTRLCGLLRSSELQTGCAREGGTRRSGSLPWPARSFPRRPPARRPRGTALRSPCEEEEEAAADEAPPPWRASRPGGLRRTHGGFLARAVPAGRRPPRAPVLSPLAPP